MKLTLYIVILAIALVACSQVPESSFDLPPEPPSPGSESLYGRAISDVGTMPSWAGAIQYTTLNKDLLRVSETLKITVQKPSFYGSQGQFIIYDKLYFYNVQTNTWTQSSVNSQQSGAAAVQGQPWRLNTGVFDLTMDSRFANGKNFFLVYYCGRATSNGTWDCGGNKWKIGTFEYNSTPAPVCNNNNICDSSETPSNCASDCKSIGSSCTSTSKCYQSSCVSGVCTAACASNSDCTGGKICSSGTCVTPVCDNDGSCESGESPSNCANDCKSAGANCTASSQCYESTCQSGVCTAPCSSSNPCTNGKSCHAGVCEVPECDSDSECSGGNICVNDFCELPFCTENSDCDSGDVCSKGRCNPMYAWIAQESCDGNDCPACPTSTTNCASGDASKICRISNGAKVCTLSAGQYKWVSAGSLSSCPLDTLDGDSCESSEKNKICYQEDGTLRETFKCVQQGAPTVDFITVTNCQGEIITDYNTIQEALTEVEGGSCSASSGGIIQACMTVSSSDTVDISSGASDQDSVQSGGQQSSQNLRWIVEGICSTPDCHGSMCAAQCPSSSATISQNSLGSACSNKGGTGKVSQGGNSDTFLLAKCGDISGVTAYSWQENVDCDTGGMFSGGSGLISCPSSKCSGQQGVGTSCSLNDMDDLCYDSLQMRDFIVACKPTTMSQVQFAQPSFPITQVPAITGAVSFDGITSSKSTQFAIVLIATMGIFIITLLNIVHKEEEK